MESQEKILVLGSSSAEQARMVERMQDRFQVVVSENFEAGVRYLQDEEFQAILVTGSKDQLLKTMMEVEGLLDQIPDGLALLEPDLKVIWANQRLEELSHATEPIVGQNFYQLFGKPEILGPDYSPFHTALGQGVCARSQLRIGEKTYYEVQACPVIKPDKSTAQLLIVVIRDVSNEILHKQKLDAIYQAGVVLGDLSPQEIQEMTVEDRVDLLKAKILHYTEDLLEFETVEMRLVDDTTKKLEPLLAVGMDEDAEQRALFALPDGSGVTGFVASTGKSYLCEDTENDPLYLPGAPGAHSSLTVPLILHDEIIGTINVESPHKGAFDETDLQFLELFSREVAVALNTLELLVAEKMTTVTESTEKILREVVVPVDEILNDAAWILEKYIGHEPTVAERLQDILRYTRDIKTMIQKVGESIGPQGGKYLQSQGRNERPLLQDKRVLVVDSDDAVRKVSHELLGRYGCEVETAHDGEEAMLMVRSFHYDVVIADIRLPDMTGYECFESMINIHPHLPVILMTGFGYDPGHSIVKARQKGLKSVLYKPFRLDQLLTELENTFGGPVAEQPK